MIDENKELPWNIFQPLLSFFNIMHLRKLKTKGSQALKLGMAFEENFKLWEVVTSLRHIHPLN